MSGVDMLSEEVNETEQSELADENQNGSESSEAASDDAQTYTQEMENE